MAKTKKKQKGPSTFAVLTEFAEVVDGVFIKWTGKGIIDSLKESLQPKELPHGESPAILSQSMSLTNAYAFLGLPETASLADVKKHYRNLAHLFHPDTSTGSEEAMKVINRAYERIMSEKGRANVSRAR